MVKLLCLVFCGILKRVGKTLEAGVLFRKVNLTDLRHCQTPIPAAECENDRLFSN